MKHGKYKRYKSSLVLIKKKIAIPPCWEFAYKIQSSEILENISGIKCIFQKFYLSYVKYNFLSQMNCNILWMIFAFSIDFRELTSDFQTSVFFNWVTKNILAKKVVGLC